MGEFFRGWKRKVGTLSLLMACLFTTGWLRSFKYEDRLDGWIPAHIVHGYIISTMGDLNIIRRFPLPPDGSRNSLNLKKLVSWRTGFVEPNYTVLLGRYAYVSVWPAKFPPDCWSEFDVAWRFDYAGFHFGEGRHETWFGWDVQLWTFPYWSIVIPLTLLSAYLILSKPRIAKPKPDSFG